MSEAEGEENRDESASDVEEAPEAVTDPDALPGAVFAAEAPAQESEPTAETAPETTDTGFQQRHPDALRLELMVGGAVIAGVSLAGLFVVTVLTAFAGSPPWLFAPALALPLILAFPFLAVPRWRHRRYLYRADDRGLELRKGIWWRSHRFIPHTRLQHTDVAQGPLERQFGLANLVVHTAGTHEARTTVSGLSLETARALRDRLTAEASEDRGAGEDGV